MDVIRNNILKDRYKKGEYCWFIFIVFFVGLEFVVWVIFIDKVGDGVFIFVFIIVG